MGNSPSSQQRHLSQQQQPRAPLSDEELRQRQQRADALEQKAAKVKRKDPEQVKAEHWRSYAEIDAQQNAKTGTAPTLTGTVASLGSMSLSSSSSSSSASSSSSSPSPAQPSTFTSAVSTTPSSLITVAPPPHVPTAVSPAPSRVPLDPREARTRLLENKVSRFKLTVGARNRKSQWEAWKELDQATRVKQSGSNTNLAGAEAAASSAAPTLSSRDSFTPPAQGSPTAASSSSSLASARSVLAQIPTTSLQLLLRIVDNVINAGHVDTPEANKVRRIRLSNPKIADAIVDVDGCVELLLMCGFTLRSETIDAADEEETVFWFDPLTALDDCRECAALLRSVLASR